MTPTSITALRVHQLAQEVGLPLVGCAPASAMPELLPTLELYYAQGRASGFEHPVASERVAPQELLPGARALIAVALPYRTSETTSIRRPKGQRGLTSTYIWGEDYHRVLHDKLTLLSERLSQAVKGDVRTVTCVDTSPLLDRAVAVKAGLGWIGKNSCLITEAYGSWVFLGALLTDLEITEMTETEAFASDASALAPLHLDACGDCTLCLTACPTGALREPYVLDSQSCLSYLTQAKGTFPEPYRAALGKRLWGCDTCQTVCPHNKVSLLGDEPRFAPAAELAYPELRDVLRLSRRALMKRYGHTAGAWRGATVWKRNALIALGNMRDHAAVEDIVPYLEDPRPELRSSAAWALERIDPMHTREFVYSAWQKELDKQTKAEMAWAAAHVGDATTARDG
ncbi:MAG: tRNA epoxyqueuosine(34) reductase QueG [Firmicutes bacterium]|nr:tRNA epoxyqueuosine(34) reductase QueG [Bacillota bacterium]